MNQQIKIGIIVVALGAAIMLVVFRGSTSEPPPDTEESATLWMCRMCKKDFMLTAFKYQEELQRAGETPLYCPGCNEKEGYRAVQCQQCNTIYHGPDVPGGSARCPKCHPQQSQTGIDTGGQQTGPDNTIIIDPDLQKQGGGGKENVIIQ